MCGLYFLSFIIFSKQRDNWKSKSSENIPTMVAREIPQHPGNSADLHGHHSLPRYRRGT